MQSTLTIVCSGHIIRLVNCRGSIDRFLRDPTAQLTPPCSVSQVERAKTSSKVATKEIVLVDNPLLEAKEDDPDDANDSLGGPERKVSRHSHLGKSISLLLGLVRSADACVLPVWTDNH